MRDIPKRNCLKHSKQKLKSYFAVPLIFKRRFSLLNFRKKIGIHLIQMLLQSKLMILKTYTQQGKEVDKEQEKNSNFNLALFQDKGQCEYQNFSSFEKISQGSITPNQIKVSNKLCQQNGQFMQKVTIIKFNNEVITLRDRYRFLSHPQQIIDNNSQKRIHIFKKPLHTQSKNQGKRRVTKNLPKNFIKAFLNYLQSVKDEKNSELLDCKMKLFTSRQKYNNSFIQKIVEDPDLEHYFVDFLNNHAKQWIERSKIRDKEVHLQAIEVFKRLSASKSDRKLEGIGSLDQFLSSFSGESQRLSQLSREENESDKQSIIANQSKNGEAQQLSS